MQSFIAPATEDDPRVEYNDGTYVMTFSDTSLVKAADEFYGEYTQMIVEHLRETPEETLEIEFRLEFVNSASQTAISRMLNQTSEACAKASPGQLVHIRWYATDDDEVTTEDAGLRLRAVSEKLKNLNFTLCR